MQTREEDINELLDLVGVDPDLGGRDLLETAIDDCLYDQSLLKELTTRLYPALAYKFETTAALVERRMRYAVKGLVNSMTTRRLDAMQERYGVDWMRPVLSGKNPTVGKFLTASVNILRTL